MVSVLTDSQPDEPAFLAPARELRDRDGVNHQETLQLRSLTQAPAMLAIVSGPDHIYEFVNERHVQVLGDRNYIGQPAREVIPEAVEQGLIDVLDRVYATGEPFAATEMPLQFKQGTNGPLEEGFYNFIYQPLRDDGNTVTGILIHAVNVTEQVRSRQRLEQLAAEHTATLSQMADGVMIVDTAGRITFQNEAARRLLDMDAVGLSVDTWLESVQLLTPEGDPLPFGETWIARTVQGGERSLDDERRLRRRDGTEMIVQGSATPVVAEDGHRYGSVFTFRDITEQKRTEEARFALAALVESSSDAILRISVDGVITGWDRGCERLYGYSAAEAIGQSVTLAMFPDRRDELPRLLARLRHGETIEHFETIRRHKDGHLVEISATASPIRDATGKITGFVSIAHDIGERKRLERERAQYQQELTTRVLQAQEDERKRIARELHDETVQDLTTLLINLDVAERRLPEGSSEAAASLARVRAIARRALDETRALAHSLRPPILDDVGLAAALDALGEEHAQTYSVTVSVDADDETHLPPYVETVVFRVAQEALTNACKHGGGSEVHIRFAIAGDVGTLTVTDNGRGFELHKVGVHGRRSGLGLDGMQERASLVGGDLHIESVPGKGTKVMLRVPVDGESVQTPLTRGVATRHDVDDTSGAAVLLVDDHAMVREGLKLILETQPGFQVIGEAEDGHGAIEMVERLHPDIVVMDVAMPNLNGFDATRQLKRRFPSVKVLILTSHENRQYVTQIVKTGADGCLLKRSAGTELVTALKTVQEGSRYISPAVAGTLLDDYRVRIDRSGDDPLTEREREVVQLVAEGHTNHGIAHKLGISIKTVETHRTNIMEKLGAADRTDLVKYAIRSGMITPD